ncbi:MAG: hypothetical protein KC657_03965 [Myxococcales bacterium]|nr:hypothetical protein [Myxococcales bacterium]
MVLLIRGKSRCSRCGQVLAKEDEIVGFTHFLGAEHHLWRYSDSAMHAACFKDWPEKDEFERLYAEAGEKRRALAKPERIEELRRAQAQEHEARIRRDAEHNASHARIMATVQEHGAVCPHCGLRSTSFRELDGTDRLRLACRACGRSCNADELNLAASDAEKTR